MGSISHHVMPLVINNLWADTHTHTNVHTDVRTETILRTNSVPGLKTNSYIESLH